MCGIAGIVRTHPPGSTPPTHEESIPEPWLDLLDESIAHRGPDGCGRFRDRASLADGSTLDVALVHRRLSIIDLAGGHQPMVLIADPDRGGCSVGSGAGGAPADARTALPVGPLSDAAADAYRRTREHSLRPCPRCASLGKTTIAVVFNGCIYNHRDLRRELEAAGHDFTTDHSDTEVLVHGCAEWGDTLPRRLRAMFAFAIWDASRAALFASRDRFGEKPLARTSELNDGCFAFASTPAALERLLRRWPRARRAVGTPAVHTWIAAGFGESIPFTDATSLCAGRSLIAPAERTAGAGVETMNVPGLFPTTDQGWRRDHPTDPSATPLNVERIECLLRAAVRRQLDADVPLGCFLSGGVDSSLVSLLAREELGTLRTLCVRMPDGRYDESPHAAHVAKVIGSRHETIDVAASPAADLVHLITQLGQPFGDSSLLPAYWLCAAARASVRVALSGDGGDELFFGYARYAACSPLRRFGWLARLVPSGALATRDPKSSSTKLARLADAARHSGYWDLVGVFPTSDLRRVVRGPIDSVLDTNQRFRLTPDEARLLDLITYLPGDLMRKSDTASMAVALEVRSPFLDAELARAAEATPARVLMPGGQRKGLLRAVARRHLPAEIVDRPKMGFAIPVGEWFRSDFGGMRQLLLDHLLGSEPFGPEGLGIHAMINMDFVRRMLREHAAAGQDSIWPWKGRDHSQRLYMLLVLSIWSKWLGRLDG